MNPPPPDPCPQPAAPPEVAASPAELLRRLDRVRDENESLGRELLRCYEQLNLVFEITQRISELEDPDSVQDLLVRRCGSMLSAGAVFLAHAERCVPVGPFETTGRAVQVAPESVQHALAVEIARVRSRPHASVPKPDTEAVAALGGVHVLVGGLRAWDSQSRVFIALRDARDPRFDSSDMLAAESALGYGGQILSNIHIVRHLQQVAVQTVCALVNAIDAKDNYTFGHSHRVAWLARLTGTALGLAKGELQSLEWAGLLHDVGKIGVSERILNKPGPLTPEEFEEVKRHPRIGYEVLRPVERFGAVLDAVLYHHENHDGSGYPEGRRGEEIPLSARIIHVVDIFDALTTTRTYRDRFPLDDAIAVLDRDAGRVTDPIVTTAFVAAIRRHMVENAGDFAQRFAHIARRAPGEKNGEVAATNGPKTTLGGANA